MCGRKGGVGKTTTATALASFFAHHGLRVLVVDLDPQSNAGFVLGADPLAPGTGELILEKSTQLQKVSDNLFVLTGGASLQDHKVEMADPEELAFALKAYDDFKVIIFDCPPCIDSLERLGLAAANIALVCTNAHPMGILGAERVIGEIKRRQERNQPGPKFTALITTQINKSRAFDKTLPAQLAVKYADIPQLSVRQNTDFSWATANCTPLMDYSPGVKCVEDIKQIAGWVIKNTITSQQ